MRQARSTSRRATVLFAVLFIVVLSSLSASTMLGAVAAERAAVGRELEDLRLNSGARSALLILMGELASQREAVLDGEAPTLPETIVIEQGEGERPVIARLLPGPGGERASPEGARIDLNHATADMLSSLPEVSTGLGERILEARERALFRSPAALLGVEGVRADFFESRGDDESALVGEPTPEPAALFTVHSFDPDTQLGLGDEARRGEPRVNINAPWSDNLERAFAERLSEETASAVRELFIDAPKIESHGSLVRLLIEESVPTETWSVLLDALTTSPEPYRPGRVDINRAPAVVLAALPGLDAASADEIVSMRERLDPAERRSPTWPLDEGVVEPEAFAELVDRITTRSLQWRVTIEVSFGETAEEGFGGAFEDSEPLLPEANEFGVMIEDDEAERDPGRALVYEVILDIAGEAPRIAYLRDRSAFEFATRLASLPEFRGDGLGGGAIEDDVPLTMEELMADAGPYDPAGSEFPGAGFGPEEAGFGEAMTLEDLGEPMGFDDLDLGFGEGGDDDEDEGPADGQTPPETAPSSGPRESGDNRLGRWTPPGGATR